jgi:16S rRNA processing protein RimM
MTQSTLVTIGKITHPYGLKGGVFIKPNNTKPNWVGQLKRVFLSHGKETKLIAVTSSRYHMQKIVIQFEGILDRTAAENLRGGIIQIPEDELPVLASDEFYVDSLVGLTLKSADSDKVLGTIHEVLSSSAGEFLEITVEGQKEPVLIPFQTVFIPKVDLENKLVFARGLDSLFDDEI